MEPDSGTQNQDEPTAAEVRAEAATQLKSARDLAKRVRIEAMHQLEDARARVARIAAREEEMAERWAQLLEAENALAVARQEQPDTNTAAPTLFAEASAEALEIIEQAREEARRIREEAMRLLAVAEGEKAESHEIAQSETERAAVEAERLTAEAQAEAQRLRDEAEAAGGAEPNAYNKRGGRKLPRIGESATSVLSEMSGLRAKSAEEDNRRAV
jgi:hypothetical protein